MNHTPTAINEKSVFWNSPFPPPSFCAFHVSKLHISMECVETFFTVLMWSLSSCPHANATGVEEKALLNVILYFPSLSLVHVNPLPEILDPFALTLPAIIFVIGVPPPIFILPFTSNFALDSSSQCRRCRQRVVKVNAWSRMIHCCCQNSLESTHDNSTTAYTKI